TTQTHIAKHFQFEEQNGYLDAVSKRDPRFERTIQHLAAEHRELAQTLERLVERADRASTLDTAFRKEIQDWIYPVQQHECQEHSIVQDAFNLDIGLED